MHAVDADFDVVEEAGLWAALAAAPEPALRERLIELHLPFARIMAARLFARRRGDEVEFDEYLQLATVGLIECVDRYDPAVGASFRTYASHRITGAILNGLGAMTEKQEQLGLRRRMRAQRLESLGEEAPAADDPAALFEALARIAVGLALGYILEDSGMYQAEAVEPVDRSYQAVELRQLQQRVAALVEALPAREKLVIRSHYLNRIPFESIADMLGVSKGRVSQLHRRALERLRDEARRVRKCDIAW